MKMKRLSAIALTACLFSIVGCKGKSARDVVRDIQAKTGEKRNEVAIAGNWLSDCQSESVIPKFKSGREAYKFSMDGTFERRHYFFSDDNCRSPSVVRVEKGDLKFPEGKNVKDGAPVDFTFNKVELETNSKGVVDVLNGIHYCDTSFSVGQKTDLSNASQKATCAGINRVPRRTYDTMKIDEGRLIIAGDASEENIKDRPSLDEASHVFVKGEFKGNGD